MIRKLAAVSAGLLTALLMSGVPGLADDTSATITVSSSGALGISGPDDSTPVSIGSATYGTGDGATTWPGAQATIADLLTALESASDISGQLGTVTVTDGRTGLTQSWTATVSWTDFQLGGTGTAADEVIEIANLRYSTGSPTASGTGTFNLQLGPVSSGGTAATYTGLVQSTTNTVTWNPTIYVDLQGEKAGTYSGTITHSVTGS